jgi:hypothetical protein
MKRVINFIKPVFSVLPRRRLELRFFLISREYPKKAGRVFFPGTHPTDNLVGIFVINKYFAFHPTLLNEINYLTRGGKKNYLPPSALPSSLFIPSYPLSLASLPNRHLPLVLPAFLSLLPLRSPSSSLKHTSFWDKTAILGGSELEATKRHSLSFHEDFSRTCNLPRIGVKKKFTPTNPWQSNGENKNSEINFCGKLKKKVQQKSERKKKTSFERHITCISSEIYSR